MITLFSTNCPKCKMLEMKMTQMGVSFEVNTDVDEMLALGLSSSPALRLDDGTLLDFVAANNWLNNLK